MCACLSSVSRGLFENFKVAGVNGFFIVPSRYFNQFLNSASETPASLLRKEKN